MEEKKPVVLVVDDHQFNLELIEEYLSDEDVETVCVDNGAEALSILEESPQRFSAVLLDRMMPGIDGMEVLSKIKNEYALNQLPVIMQTAQSGKENVLEGLTAGAHYYLSKPYSQHELTKIVASAIRDYQGYLEIQERLKQTTQPLQMMISGVFSFKSLSEARNLAALLANFCPDPNSVIVGLSELMVNAVEHGNLGITYQEKSSLNAEGEWENEVARRLEMTAYSDKQVTVEYMRNDNEVTFQITDEGSGFDWEEYMEISPEHAFDSHGRGITMAKTISFNKVEYLDTGNKVLVTVLCNKPVEI